MSTHAGNAGMSSNLSYLEMTRRNAPSAATKTRRSTCRLSVFQRGPDSNRPAGRQGDAAAVLRLTAQAAHDALSATILRNRGTLLLRPYRQGTEVHSRTGDRQRVGPRSRRLLRGHRFGDPPFRSQRSEERDTLRPRGRPCEPSSARQRVGP